MSESTCGHLTSWPHSAEGVGCLHDHPVTAPGLSPEQAARVAVTVPTNADLAERAKGMTAREVVRNWLARHPSSVGQGWWLDWAADNFLADPEIAQHLRPVAAIEDAPAAEDVVERVARAMHKADPHAWSCGWPCPTAAVHYRRMAAAAIEVLRGETR